MKEALKQEPDNGELLYLMGMTHSNLGMIDRAIEEISQALARAPNLINARFQLGLMHFIQREFARSEAVWQPLIAALPPDEPLRIFATGLTLVGQDDLRGAIDTLERGIALCRNEQLNQDIGRIVAEARRYLAETANGEQQRGADVDQEAGQGARHVLLSGYGEH